MCKVLNIHRSGYYAWLKTPKSCREIEDDRLFELIRESWKESEGIYGSPKIYADLREWGESCGLNRVARIMKQRGLKALRMLKRPRFSSGLNSGLAENHLDREFKADGPNKAWVTDITYIRTREGFLYLAVVIDLFSRAVVGWSMKNHLKRDLVIDALIMAVWRRQPENEVLIHSDQGSQFGSDDWIRFCKSHGLKRSMSRRGNCWDNAVAESFFSSLKKEKVPRKSFITRKKARSVIFNYIEVFYNRKRRHEYLNWQSPIDFETRFLAS